MNQPVTKLVDLPIRWIDRSYDADRCKKRSDDLYAKAKDAAHGRRVAEALHLMRMSARWLSLSRRLAWIPRGRA